MAGKDKSYKWKEDKLIRFDACFECGITKDECIIHYHHVVPHSRGGKNAIPLCVDCHDKVHDGVFQKAITNPLHFVKLMGDGRKKAIARGVRFGRKDGEIESKDKFMNKPSTKEVIELLKKGKTYRDIEDITGISPKKIGKVKKLLVDDGVIEINKKNGRIVLYQRKFF